MIIQKALRIDPNFVAAYIARSEAKMKLGNPHGSIKDLDAAIELDSKNSFAYRVRGIQRETLADLEGACADWSKAAELGDKSPVAEWVKKQC